MPARHTLVLMPQLRIAQDEHADEVLSNDPFALLVGMLLDQQFPMERAFAGPAKILDRFGTLDPAAIAAADAVAFADLCATPPAIHRYGRSMAGRVQDLARVVLAEYDGDAAAIWSTSGDTATLLPDDVERIAAASTAGQGGTAPPPWSIGPYAEPGSFRSVADVVDEQSLLKVRAFKKAAKAAATSAT